MANLERIYTIPLREAFEHNRSTRAKRAVKVVREFALRHMKAETVKVSEGVNSLILRDGIQKPPRRIKVRIVKDDAGVAKIWLIGEQEKIAAQNEKKKQEEEAKKKAAEAKKEAKPAIQAQKPATQTNQPANKIAQPAEAKPATQTANPPASKPAASTGAAQPAKPAQSASPKPASAKPAEAKK